MIEGWEKGPRDRTKTTCQVHESADWIRRLGPQVAIEARDLNGSKGREENADRGVVYAELVVGEGPDAYRVTLGPVLYGPDAGEWESPPIQVTERAEAVRIQECRGREAAVFMLARLREAE